LETATTTAIQLDRTEAAIFVFFLICCLPFREVALRPVLFSAEKLRLQEELFRLRSHRKENESRREHLLNKAKVLQVPML